MRPPPLPQARHATVSCDTWLSMDTPTAFESKAFTPGRCTELGPLVDALHARHHPVPFPSEISNRLTNEISRGGDPDTRCDSSTWKLSLGLNPRDRARDPLPMTHDLHAFPRRAPPSDGKACVQHFLGLGQIFVGFCFVFFLQVPHPTPIARCPPPLVTSPARAPCLSTVYLPVSSVRAATP